MIMQLVAKLLDMRDLYDRELYARMERDDELLPTHADQFEHFHDWEGYPHMAMLFGCVVFIYWINMDDRCSGCSAVLTLNGTLKNTIREWWQETAYKESLSGI